MVEHFHLSKYILEKQTLQISTTGKVVKAIIQQPYQCEESMWG